MREREKKIEKKIFCFAVFHESIVPNKYTECSVCVCMCYDRK